MNEQIVLKLPQDLVDDMYTFLRVESLQTQSQIDTQCNRIIRRLLNHAPAILTEDEAHEMASQVDDKKVILSQLLEL